MSSSIDRATLVLAGALALIAVSACNGDDADPSAAGSGAGAAASGGEGGTSGAGSGGQGGAGGPQAGQGGASAGAGGTSGAAGTSGTDAGAGDGGDGGGGGEPDGGSDAGAELEGCVVAQDISACCPTWIPVTRARAYADPCLIAIGEPVTGTEGQHCLPEVCTDVLCLDDPPHSRVAAPLGPSGACQLVDECHAEATCVIGVDMTRCCACPESLPAELVERERCVVLATMSALPDGCLNPCPTDCAECPDLPDAPSCAVRDSASLCQ